MSWLPGMMFMHTLDDDEPDQPKQADESDDTHQTHNWITRMDDKDLDAFLATCLCVIIVSVLATIYMIWRIIALFMAYV